MPVHAKTTPKNKYLAIKSPPPLQSTVSAPLPPMAERRYFPDATLSKECNLISGRERAEGPELHLGPFASRNVRPMMFQQACDRIHSRARASSTVLRHPGQGMDEPLSILDAMPVAWLSISLACPKRGKPRRRDDDGLPLDGRLGETGETIRGSSRGGETAIFGSRERLERLRAGRREGPFVERLVASRWRVRSIDDL